MIVSVNASEATLDSTASVDLARELGLAPTDIVLILPMIVLADFSESFFDTSIWPGTGSSRTSPRGDGEIRAGNKAEAADFDRLLPRPAAERLEPSDEGCSKRGK